MSRILARAHGEKNVKFMMTTVRRQAASCLYGLAPLLRDMLAEKLDILEAMDGTDGETPGNGGEKLVHGSGGIVSLRAEQNSAT